jgi:hypothetical protein
MNVKYQEARQWGEAHSLLQQATKQLEEIVGRSADQVTAEWDRGQDERGRTFFSLKLSDRTGEVTAQFTPKELQHPR